MSSTVMNNHNGMLLQLFAIKILPSMAMSCN